MIEIGLGSEELLMGAHAGMIRRFRKRKAKDSWGFKGTGWTNDIEGALAELAVAKHLGVYWSGQEGWDSLDVVGYQVRQTAHEKGHLLLHPKDADAHRFLLVVGKLGHYRIAGWCYGSDGKLKEYWHDRNTREKCWNVPQSALSAWDGTRNQWVGET